MKFKVTRIRIFSLLVCLMALSGVSMFHAQNQVLGENYSIIVNLSHMDLGDVFPGQEVKKDFVVSYAGRGDGKYTIDKKYKPKPGAKVPDDYKGSISDYCQINHDDLARCYRFLCPYINVYSSEKESDTMDNASVSATDLTDVWTVSLKTPAIVGKVSQDYKGSLVSEAGEYGCDLSFNVGLPPAPVCGNGKVESGEECDDGNRIDNDECSSSCKINKGSISGCKYNDKNGNGKIDCGESKISGWKVYLIKCPYDPLPTGSSARNKKSTIISGMTGYCSVKADTVTGADGCYSFANLSAGDYGVNEEDKSGWTQTYPEVDTYYYFNLTPGKNVTGINFLNHQESSSKPVCGNGKVESGEECDDGNKTNGDGCSCDCKKEAPVCGNGRLENGEECDDSNVKNGDGCSSVCKKETPSPVCGNSVKEDGEECDDGNKNNYDGCSSSCKKETPVCGNGHKESGEECDDSNTNNGDGCSSSCKTEILVPVCGNGKVESGEGCDDGNRNNGDGCSASCSTESSGGGGGGGITPLRITQEKVFDVKETSAKFTWLTNKKADSRVVCGKTSIPKSSLGAWPNYGYEFSTITYDTEINVSSHAITMFDLTSNTTYYCRVISKKGSQKAISTELSFKTKTHEIIVVPPEIKTLYIYNLTLQGLTKTSTSLKWNTNINGTTCVVYSKASKFLGEKPKYGYEWNTADCWNLSKQNIDHSTIIGGLEPCTTYYFRLTSTNGTLDAVTEEQRVKTLCQATSTYYPRTYVPAISTPPAEEPEEPGQVEAAEVEKPECPACEKTECPVCEAGKEVVKTVVEKERYMSCEDWFILFLILVALMLLANALLGRRKRNDGGDGMIMGGGSGFGGSNANTAKSEALPKPADAESEDISARF